MRLLPLSLVLLSVTASAQPWDDDPLPGREHTLGIERDDGRKGVAVFPATFSGTELTGILDPSGYRVHLTDADDPGDEVTFAAGELFDPPTGRFRYWLQGEWRMTPFTELASFRPNRPAGAKTMRALPVVPAGRVVLAGEPAVDPELELRLLYVGGDPIAGLMRHELSRRKPVAELREGLLMPTGPVVAALWDARQGRYVAITRPFAVEAGKAVTAPLRWPAASSADLLVYVDRNADDTPASALPGFALTMDQRDARRPPDVSVTTPWGVYGIWYGLAPGRAVLGGANDRLYLEPTTLTLTGGRITRHQGKLSRQLFASP